MSHNVWSGTDLGEQLIYSQDYITARQISVESSNEYSSNGNYSIKINPIDSNAWVRFILNLSSEHFGKTLKFTTKIYSPTISNTIYLLIVDSNNNNLTNLNITVPQNDNFTNVELTSSIVENAARAYFHFGSPQALFIDELNVNIQ